MNAHVIDGKAMAEKLRNTIKTSVTVLKSDTGVTPGLAVVLVGDDPASDIYVKSKVKQTAEVGMKSFEFRLPAETTEMRLLNLIESLNHNKEIHGILVQLPLPPHIDAVSIINCISPKKDVDGFHTSNVGLIGTGQDAMVPCTPLGCMLLLREHVATFSGLTALVIGHSNVVGKPMARLLLNADCTVMVTHKSSTNIPELARMADILVVAAGVPGLVKANWIKPGAIVIDVGINRIAKTDPFVSKTRIVGDVDFNPVQKVAGAITPVPGGVGPMTIACLLSNTLNACLAGLGRTQHITS